MTTEETAEEHLRRIVESVRPTGLVDFAVRRSVIDDARAWLNKYEPSEEELDRAEEAYKRGPVRSVRDGLRNVLRDVKAREAR